MKHVWRTKEKDLYIGKKKPEVILIPEMKYFVMSGAGNPNEVAFQQCVQALYTLSYTIRMMPKSGFVPEGYFEYTVYPLEGIWTSSESYETIQKREGVDKDCLVYDVMIRQPDFVDAELFASALEKAAKKLNTHQLTNLRFETHEAHRAVQMLHEGPYANEMASFKQMNQFIAENNFEKDHCAYHREIYLRMDESNDARNQTTLRYRIKD